MRVISPTALLALVAAAGSTNAVPMGPASGFSDAAVSKVLRARVPAPAPTQAPKPQAVEGALKQLTVTVSNRHTAAVTTRHAGDPSHPGPSRAIRGTLTTGTIPSGDKGIYVVPIEHIGAVFINDAKYQPGQHCTQIEVSLIRGELAFDVSNVTGWSLPVVCKCFGADLKTSYESGCDVDLAQDAKSDPSKQCPKWNKDENACENPYRDNSATRVAVPFFKKCQGKSYTFVNDHEALRHNLCKTEHMTCCIGTKCKKGGAGGGNSNKPKPSPNQPPAPPKPAPEPPKPAPKPPGPPGPPKHQGGKPDKPRGKSRKH